MGIRIRGLTLVAALVAAMVAPAQQTSAATFAVSGTVTANGAPVAGVVVYAYVGGDGAVCCEAVSGAVTAADGTYSIDLEPGSYRVRFYPNTNGLVEEWWDGASGFGSSDDVVVQAENETGIDASLLAGSTITGTITNAGGIPLEGIGVHAMDASEECCIWVTGTSTAADGTYALTVPNGSYRLFFYSSGLEISKWSGNAPTFEEATDIVVPGSPLSGNDAQLAAGQAISGRVTDTDGDPIEGVYVHAFETGVCCSWVDGAQTDANGEYSISVADGQYVLMFWPALSSEVAEWWDGATEFESATPITVAGSGVSGKDAVLAGGNRISGTVTGANGAPVENVFVGAFDAKELCCTWVAGAATDAMGKYRLDVPNGTYRLVVYPWDGVHLSEWFPNAGSFEVAVDIEVEGNDLSGFNFVLSAGTAISGTVTGGGGPLENVYVGAYLASSGVCCEYAVGTGTDANGDYVLSVPPGDYKLMFYPMDGEFTAEWWNNAADYESATVVSVGGAPVTGRNATLATGLSITGRVTNGSGDEVEGAYVIAFRIDGVDLQWAGGAVTDGDGEYSIVVAPGQYIMQVFGPDGYLWQWYDGETGTQDQGSAEPVIVVEGGDPDPLEPIVLSGGDPISGTVNDEATGEPLPGVDVLVYTSDCETFVAWTATDGLGNYSVTLGSGQYKIWFLHYGGYASEWYYVEEGLDEDGIETCAHGVAVRGGATDIDAHLTPLGAENVVTGIVAESGTCDFAGCEPIAGATVVLLDTQGNAVGQDLSNANGEFSIPAPDARYYLMVSRVGYADEWFPGYPSLDVAQGDTSFEGNVIPGDVGEWHLDQLVVTGTTFDQDVCDEGGGCPPVLGGVTVTAYAFDPSSNVQGAAIASTTSDDTTGQYSLGLPAGNYILKFSKDQYVDIYQAAFGIWQSWAEAWDDAWCCDGHIPVPTGGNTFDRGLRSDAVSGTVYDFDGSSCGGSLSGITVAVYDLGGNEIGVHVITDASGNYSISTGGQGGEYVVKYAGNGQEFFSASGWASLQEAIDNGWTVSVPGASGIDYCFGQTGAAS